MTSSFESTASEFAESEFRPDVQGNFVLNVEEATPAQREAADRGEHERLRAKAYESGKEEGFASARALCEPALQALSAAAAELSVQRHDYLEAQRELLVQLAVEIAERIIGRELAQHPDWIVDRIAATLALVDSKAPVIVELHPDDHAVATGNDVQDALSEDVQLVANANLEAGDFRVASGRTTIDARLASLLQGAREALAGLETLPESLTEPTSETSE